MGYRRLQKYLWAKWEPIWAKREAKLAFVIVGTSLLTGTFYYPIVKALFFTKERDAVYDSSNFYPIKVRKQREQEAEEKNQTISDSTKQNLS